MRLGTALKVLATVAGRRINAGVEEKKGLLQFWFWMFCFGILGSTVRGVDQNRKGRKNCRGVEERRFFFWRS